MRCVASVCEGLPIVSDRRIPNLAPEAADPPVAEALAAAPPLDIFAVLAHAQGVFRPFMRYGLGLLRDLELDPGLRELAILRVAALTPGGAYEWQQHEPIARAVGVSDVRIEAARTGTGAVGDDALVLAFTEEVVRAARQSAETWAAAAARLEHREIVELLLVIGQYMMLARVMATAGLERDANLGGQTLLGF
jgi:alkylhydroperoxidase family enzyme